MEVDFFTLRIYERLIMTGIVFFLGICMVFYMMFKDPMQEVSAKAWWVTATFRIFNPLLVLGVMVAYSWVSLSNPMVRERPLNNNASNSNSQNGVFAGIGESGITERALGGTSATIQGVYERLYTARALELGTASLSLLETADLLDLSLKYADLDVAAAVPENLFSNGATFKTIEQGILDGHSALDR